MVHQHASPFFSSKQIGYVNATIVACSTDDIPWDCSCKPTSKASLSLEELVERQAKYLIET